MHGSTLQTFTPRTLARTNNAWFHALNIYPSRMVPRSKHLPPTYGSRLQTLATLHARSLIRYSNARYPAPSIYLRRTLASMIVLKHGSIPYSSKIRGWPRLTLGS